MDDLSVCAALYCVSAFEARVSLAWLDAMIARLSSQARIRECHYFASALTALGCGPFEVLETDLRAAVSAGRVVAVELNAHREKDQLLTLCWEASADINLERGSAFIGIPDSSGIPEAELLKSLYAASKSITPWRYGIGYDHSTARAPGLFAIGLGGGSISDQVERFEDDPAFQQRLSLWRDEHWGDRRYLHGMFRGVYSANLLTEEHVQARLKDGTPLLQSGLGTFEELDPGVWLWETGEEYLRARAALQEVGLLICWPAKA